jgi:hypothetical protein
MQQWYGLSDPAMEDALYDIESMKQFADIDIEVDVIPDETTILHLGTYWKDTISPNKYSKRPSDIFPRKDYFYEKEP